MIWKSFPGVLALVLCICSLKAQDGRKIFAEINSEYDEQNPVLSPDGQTLYFTRSHHPDNIGGKRDKGDIWYSRLMAGMQWSAPENAILLNNKGWNGVIGFSAEGSTIYLHNHYKEESGIVKSQGIAKSVKRRKGWSAPVDIDIPYFKNLSRNVGGSISTDGTVLLLSIESYGTKGGEDIYVCFRKKNGQWSEPKNLGSTINSAYQEFSPYISDDLKTLYFSSNGRNGKGSSDIFVAERLDDSWSNWSTPRLLDHLNTKGREKDYRIYRNFALYSSTISSDGYSDLKLYTEKPVDSLMQVTEPVVMGDTAAVIHEVHSPGLNGIRIWGKVQDASNNSRVNAIVTLAGNTSFQREIPTGNDGSYTVTVPDSGMYDIRIDAPGYISERETITIASRDTVVEFNYKLQPIEVGTTINLENVLFERSTDNILETSYEQLNLVVDFMKQNPSVEIRLEGHTDNRGVAKHNKRLSKKRARAVRDYLVEHGVSKRRISEKGYGGSRPIADNNDPDLRKLNRRVEFTIVKK